MPVDSPRGGDGAPVFVLAVVVLLAWGALAFGAEYAWAYAPLLVLALVAGALGLRVSNRASVSRVLALALFAVLGAAVIQAIPLPGRIASNGPATVVDYDRLRADVVLEPSPASRPKEFLSIAPDKTFLGLTFLLALIVLFWGTVKAASATGISGVTRGIVLLGVAVAFVGIIQAATRSEQIYGFWSPPRDNIPFAPFLNENHFAGWTVMALSSSSGALLAMIARGTTRARSGWRDRLVWLSSPAASAMVLTGFAILVMALAIVVTFSRGGLVGLTVTAVSLVWCITRRQTTGPRRVAGVIALAFLLLVVLSWGGVGRTLDDFGGSAMDWGGRKAIWLDTWRVIQDYPWTGTGLNTFGIAMLHYQQAYPGPERVIEAHNDYLQLAAEGGLLLGIPILITIALYIREVWKRFKEGADDEHTYWLRAGAVTGLISISVMEIFDFTLQMPGAAALFVVLAAIAIHRPDYLARRREARAHRE